MSKGVSEQQKYDPWESKQEITDIKIIVHCSRYWMLSEWECKNMSFPFWRLYSSSMGGAFVYYDGKETELSPGKIIIIPPHTSFSTRLSKTYRDNVESIKGVRIKSRDEVELFKRSGYTDQFFVHFNLGFPYDKVKPGIYEYVIDKKAEELINKNENNRLNNPGKIDFKANVNIFSLILAVLDQMPANIHYLPDMDKRVMRVIDYIDKHISDSLVNDSLANIANLATNSFTRLFRENMDKSVQKYVQERRIENAILLLHHSNFNIDEISDKCGFYDRHHFSKLFKQSTGLPPIEYKQKLITVTKM